MRVLCVPASLFLIAAAPLHAEGTRQLDAHEHGVGSLNIAFLDSDVAMEFTAPGADIVGFEYEAETDEDKAAIEAAIATLGRPSDLFAFPDAAGCTVAEVHAALEDEHDNHDDHGDEEHDDHDDHAEDEKHDDHEEHAEEAEHTEFHAEYTLTCENPDAFTEMTFGYFDVFPNAVELEVQIVTEAGAKAFEVERDAPVLDLRGAF